MSLDSTLERLEAIEASAASLGRDLGVAVAGGSSVDPSQAATQLIAWSKFYGGPEVETGVSGWRIFYEQRRSLLHQAIAAVKASGGKVPAVLLGLLFPGFGGSLVFLDQRTQGQAETYASRLRELYDDFKRLGGTATTPPPAKLPPESDSTLGKIGAAVFKETKEEIESLQTTGRILAFAALGVVGLYAVSQVRGKSK